MNFFLKNIYIEEEEEEANLGLGMKALVERKGRVWCFLVGRFSQGC